MIFFFFGIFVDLKNTLFCVVKNDFLVEIYQIENAINWLKHINAQPYYQAD